MSTEGLKAAVGDLVDFASEPGLKALEVVQYLAEAVDKLQEGLLHVTAVNGAMLQLLLNKKVCTEEEFGEWNKHFLGLCSEAAEEERVKAAEKLAKEGGGLLAEGAKKWLDQEKSADAPA